MIRFVNGGSFLSGIKKTKHPMATKVPNEPMAIDIHCYWLIERLMILDSIVFKG